jgi:hypothetical protein
MTLLDITNAITDFRQDIENIRSSGIYEFFTKFFAEYIKWAIVGWYKFKLQSIIFAYDVASEMLSSLNLSQVIDSAFLHLDSRVSKFVFFFRIPEALNLIFSAYTTRIVMNFLGL